MRFFARRDVTINITGTTFFIFFYQEDFIWHKKLVKSYIKSIVTLSIDFPIHRDPPFCRLAR